jgi:hypothetical protein
MNNHGAHDVMIAVVSDSSVNLGVAGVDKPKIVIVDSSNQKLCWRAASSSDHSRGPRTRQALRSSVTPPVTAKRSRVRMFRAAVRWPRVSCGMSAYAIQERAASSVLGRKACSSGLSHANADSLQSGHHRRFRNETHSVTLTVTGQLPANIGCATGGSMSV